MAQFISHFDQYSLDRRKYVLERLKEDHPQLFNQYADRLVFPVNKGGHGYQQEEIDTNTDDGKFYSLFKTIAERLIQEYENAHP